MNDEKKLILEAYKLLMMGYSLKAVSSLLETNELKLLYSLTNNFKKYMKEDANVFTSEMYDNICVKLNLVEEEKFDISPLDKMYKTESKKLAFIGKCILTFGLRLETISGLMGVDKEVLNRNLGNISFYHYISNTFKMGVRDQKNAANEFKSYFNELVELYESKDKEKIAEHLMVLSDKKVDEFRKKHKPGDKISEDDLVEIVKYQIKYNLTGRELEEYLNISRQHYVERVKELEKTAPKLYFDYVTMSDCFFKKSNKEIRR